MSLTLIRSAGGLAAVGYTAATVVALFISLTVGLLGLHQSTSAAHVTQSLALETITLLALLSGTVLVASTSDPDCRGRTAAVPTKHTRP